MLLLKDTVLAVALLFLNLFVFGFIGPALISSNSYIDNSLGILSIIFLIIIDVKVVIMLGKDAYNTTHKQ